MTIEQSAFALPLDVPAGAIPLGVSNSELTTFTDCPRKWFLQYYMGWAKPPENLNPVGSSQLGIRIHVALQGYYGRALNPVEVLRAVYEREVERYPLAHEELRKEFDMAAGMIIGYAEWLEETSADRLLRPVGAETAVTYPVGFVLPDSPFWFYLKGHLDVMMYDEEFSRYIFMDHKSVGSFDPLNLLQILEQMKIYVMLQRLNAMASGGTIQVGAGYFNMLKRSKRTARATPPFYHREPVTYNNETMNSMWLRTYHRLQQIAATREALDKVFREASSANLRTRVQQALVAPTPSHDCTWKCPFFQQCPLMDDGSRWEDALAGAFRQGDPYAYYGRGLLEELIEEGRVASGQVHQA